MDLDLRDIADAGHLIRVEILLYGHTVLKMCFVCDGGAQGHYNASFHLGADDIGVYIPAAVHQGDHFVDLYLPVRLMGYFHHFSYDAAEAFSDGNSPACIFSP